jgi:hypothetical protein
VALNQLWTALELLGREWHQPNVDGFFTHSHKRTAARRVSLGVQLRGVGSPCHRTVAVLETGRRAFERVRPWPLASDPPVVVESSGRGRPRAFAS